ncbi:MAG TPA: pinensin family lanthipeptide [Longimicrobium sp.]|nr:pinensin family lanthipeptide [Longimicrobium sp.]
MEKRRKLNLNDLEVESFETTDLEGMRGTVQARATWYWETCPNCTGATCGGLCTDPDCNSGQWDCDSLGCGSDQPDTCYAGCEDTCRDTRTSVHGWVSCNHSYCPEYTCDPFESCHQASGEYAC